MSFFVGLSHFLDAMEFDVVQTNKQKNKTNKQNKPCSPSHKAKAHLHCRLVTDVHFLLFKKKQNLMKLNNNSDKYYSNLVS